MKEGFELIVMVSLGIIFFFTAFIINAPVQFVVFTQIIVAGIIVSMVLLFPAPNRKKKSSINN